MEENKKHRLPKNDQHHNIATFSQQNLVFTNALLPIFKYSVVAIGYCNALEANGCVNLI